MINRSDSESCVGSGRKWERVGEVQHRPSLGHHCSYPVATAMWKGRPTVVRAGNWCFAVNVPLKRNVGDELKFETLCIPHYLGQTKYACRLVLAWGIKNS